MLLYPFPYITARPLGLFGAEVDFYIGKAITGDPLIWTGACGARHSKAETFVDVSCPLSEIFLGQFSARINFLNVAYGFFVF